MNDDKNNPILDSALHLMNAAVPGMFEDPVNAWRDLVSQLRYVVIAKTDSPTIEQLKALQSHSSSFTVIQASNLVEIRKAIMENEIRLEPVTNQVAELVCDLLSGTGLVVNLVPLSEEEQSAQLAILDTLPPFNTAP